MSITSFIRRVCVQDAVYWEYAGPDGFGGTDFESPVEIKVRWDESTEIVSTQDGQEYISEAQLLVPQNLLEQSYVVLGTLADLPADPDPQDIDDAYEIKAMDRHPLFQSETFDVFLAYL